MIRELLSNELSKVRKVRKYKVTYLSKIIK